MQAETNLPQNQRQGLSTTGVVDSVHSGTEVAGQESPELDGVWLDERKRRRPWIASSPGARIPERSALFSKIWKRARPEKRNRNCFADLAACARFFANMRDARL